MYAIAYIYKVLRGFSRYCEKIFAEQKRTKIYGMHAFPYIFQYGHPLCNDCYFDLVARSYVRCPLCDREMVLTDFNELYAIFIKVTNEITGIIYLPPIIICETEIDHDIFYGDDNRIFDVLGVAIQQGYTIVPNDELALKKLINEHLFSKY